MTRAFVALGSNLGDRVRHLTDAIAGLPDVVASSDVYETVPLGGPEGQDPYLNCVVQLDTPRRARQLLAVGQALEAAAGRVRDVRWGPRTLDVDILWVDGEVIEEPDLVVPHPRIHDRPFVLAPLRELAPDLVAEDWAESFANLGLRRLGRLDAL